MEHAVAQRSVDVAVGLVDGILDKGLVLWLAHPCRMCHAHIVVGKVVHALCQVGLVSVGSLHGRFEIVGYKDFGHASEKFHGLDCGCQKLLYALRAHAGYEGHARVWQHGHIGHHKDFLACVRIDV